MKTNFLTEEQAKEKWCLSDTVSINCCASSCMAWRWRPLIADDRFNDAVKERRKATEDKGANLGPAIAYVRDHPEEFGLPADPFTGYCGLAGKPEV